MNKNKRIVTTILITLVSIVFIPTLANADGQLEAVLTVEEKVYSVGDPVSITLSVEHPAGYQVIFPNLDTEWGEFVVKSTSPPSTTTNDDGTETSSQVLDVRLFSPGSFTTPQVDLTVSDSEGNLYEISAAPAAVTITSVLIDGDNQLRDIKPQMDMPFFNIWPWLIGLFTFALVIVGFSYLRNRARRRKELAAIDKRLPHEVALDELDRIEALKLPESGNFKEHYTLTADCLRLYLEKAFDVPFLERATYEIESNMRTNGISREIVNLISAFLIDSDLVKFSKFKPDVANSYELISLGRTIINKTKHAFLETGGGDQTISADSEGKLSTPSKNFSKKLEVTT